MSCASLDFPMALPKSAFHNFSSISILRLNRVTALSIVILQKIGPFPFFLYFISFQIENNFECTFHKLIFNVAKLLLTINK